MASTRKSVKCWRLPGLTGKRVMSYNAVLGTLIDELNAGMPVANIGWRNVQTWPDGALDMFTRAGVLSNASEAQSLECQGCEHHCFKDVVFQIDESKSSKRVYIVCEEPEMQEQMGRIQIPLEHLKQWKISVNLIARVIAGLLGFDKKIEHKSGKESIQLGMLNSKNGRCRVTLNTDPLELEINGYAMPLEEVLYFENDELLIDRPQIDDYLNRASRKDGKQYSPSTDKQEARKLETDSRHQSWKDEYQKLRKIHPSKSDVWISIKINNMPIAQGAASETIRKNMKD